MKKLLLALPTLFVLNSVLAQDHDAHSGHEEVSHEDFKRHSLTLEFGYTHIPDGFEEIEGDQSVWVPTFGLAYGYQFSHRFKAALMFNLETGNYLINVNREDLNRENVFIIAAVAVYEIAPNWGVFAGPGIELEKHHNFAVLRFGTEYAIPIKNNLYFTPLVTFDHKIDYTSWELAIALTKRF